jgi:(p)ppGpp synthase/HD superfamily hydrolase
MIKHKNIKDKSEFYACKMHGMTNQMFDGHPYRFHLRSVVDVAMEFIHLIPKPDRDTVLGGAWAHDLIEDAGVTYNDTKNNTNLIVAEYAYALTNDKGRNRAERANPGYYYGIRIYKHASFIKLCDRISNVRYSKEHGSSMYGKYKKEYEHFKIHLYDRRWEEMWKVLDDLLK